MRWDAINDGIWIVGTVGSMKRKEVTHHLPMTDSMERVIAPMKDYGSVWVFPGRDSHMSLSRFVGYLKTVYPEVSPHICRHSFASICADKDIDSYGVSLVLHHSVPGITHQTYNKSQHIERKRAVLEAMHELLYGK
jgi:integrase